MCHQFHLDIENKKLERLFNVPVPNRTPPQTNFFPKMDLLTLINEKNRYQFQYIPWKFIINSEIDVINIRSETVSRKPSFSELYPKNRCIIPATSILEKRKSIRFEKHSLFFIAGLYKPNPSGIAMLTTESDPSMQNIHHRMPCLIRYRDISTWLNPRSNYDTLDAIKYTWQTQDCTIHP